MSIKEKRKNEIKEVAIRCFLEKGIRKTTMEDIIARTTLSKGGVYYYYKNTSEMLLDIFRQGNEDRFEKIRDFAETNHVKQQELCQPAIMAELIIQKIMVSGNMVKVYSLLLVEANYDENLFKILQSLVQETKKSLMMIFGVTSNSLFAKEYDFITNLINTFILGVNLLGGRSLYEENLLVLKEMIIHGLKKLEEKQ